MVPERHCPRSRQRERPSRKSRAVQARILGRRKRPWCVIMPSNRGAQSACTTLAIFLKTHGLMASRAHKDRGTDHAPGERRSTNPKAAAIDREGLSTCHDARNRSATTGRIPIIASTRAQVAGGFPWEPWGCGIG